MIGELFILTLTFFLFVYWFQYSCGLILSARTTRDFAAEVAERNRLRFPAVRDCLCREGNGQTLAVLRGMLQQDYERLLVLLEHAPDCAGAALSPEVRMLRLRFLMLRARYGVFRVVLPGRAKRVLQEMADIVGYLANAMGAEVAEVLGV